MKRSIKDWFIILAALLDELAIVLLVLLLLWFLKIPISLPVIILLVLFFVATVFIMHRLIIPALHKKIETGSEGMIGLKGEVIEPLAPEGVVRVKDEYWKALSSDKNMVAGEQVEVVRIDGLTLHVKHTTQ
jgi:membrane protein implicated in regulation of membrane protease activity